MSKYTDIMNFINNNIESGNINYGKKLPTIRFLSEKFNCSKQTVVHAYERLESEHIVYSVPQSGYYLVDKKELHENNKNKIINFSSGAPDESILPYEEFQHCLNQAIDIYKVTLFNYSNTKGLFSLLNTLKKHFEDYQIFCNTQNIFVTTGSQQAINILCSMPYPNGKNTVLVEQPTYNGVLEALKITKTPVIGIKRGFNGIDFEELERKFACDNIKCFYTLPRFSNPLGTSYSLEDKKQILKLAEKYDVYIIEDDYLCDLEYKNNTYPMYYSDLSFRVSYIKSFSKLLLPGLRIAACVLPPILTNTFEQYKKWMDLNTSVLSQGALEIYIKSGMFKSNKKRVKNIYRGRMNSLKEIYKEINLPNVNWHIPDTGFYSCIEFLNGFNIDWLIKECYKNDILLSIMNENYLSDYLSTNILKISIGNSKTDDIKNGIKKIAKIIMQS